MIGARQGSPLAVGYGKGEMFLGSDAMALAPFTDRVMLPRGRRLGCALAFGSWIIYDDTGVQASRPISERWLPRFLVDKGNHRHFMAKEIHEQPEVIGQTLAHYVRFADSTISASRASASTFELCPSSASPPAARPFTRACRPNTGSSVTRGCRSRWISPRSSATAKRRWTKDGMALFVSQSGETADTLAACAIAAAARQHIVLHRQRAEFHHRPRDRRRPADARRARDRRRLDQGLHLPARGAGLPRDRGRPRARHDVRGGGARIRARALSRCRASSTECCGRARRSTRSRENSPKAPHVLYLGRGTSYPIALEGALKLKEISYIHAEVCGGRAEARADCAGRRGHAGDRGRAATRPAREDRSRTCRRCARAAASCICSPMYPTPHGMTGARDFRSAAHRASVPSRRSCLHSAAAAAGLSQRGAAGTDVDQPRNLAKTVTVE